jgi:predicted RNA binding protein YcfA (HicA-like mRNA interferase family)
MKAREVEQLVLAAGWVFAGSKGSHRKYKHPNRPGSVIIPWHGKRDVATGTLLAILRQAGLR